MSQHTKRHEFRFPLILLLLLSATVSGCGTVGDSFTKMAALQDDPGPLYSYEFYETATPEEVRQAIGSRSLATESFTYKRYESNAGPVGGAVFNVTPIIGLFWPMGYVERTGPAYPIERAVWSTPYPEVISLMFEAGATMEQVDLPRYLEYGKDDERHRKILRVLLDKMSTQDRVLALKSVVKADSREMVDVIMGYPDMQGYLPPDNAILATAVMSGKNDMAVYLRERGLYAAPTHQGEMQLLGQALYVGNYEGFHMLVSWGCDYTRVVDGKNRLFSIAAERREADSSLPRAIRAGFSCCETRSGEAGRISSCSSSATALIAPPGMLTCCLMR